MRNNSKTQLLLTIGVVCLLAGGLICGLKLLGIGAWGPERNITAKILSKHVDFAGSKREGTIESHYMVTTDKGTFEVTNGIMLGVADADRIYGSLVEGKTYRLTVQGNEYVNFFMQHYPYIVDFVPQQ